MCGITGFYNKRLGEQAIPVLERMLEVIQHRGPDAQGMWHEEALSLGHQRLSILDLTATGSQPMVSHCQRYVIVFNGELYNAPHLRQSLNASSEMVWRGHSDTEVMIEAISKWGIDKAIQEFNGMFSFALWDRIKKQLILARDRFGEKPLYYQSVSDAIIFGSELKCLEQFPFFSPDIDYDAVGEYLKYKYVPAPFTLYKNTRKLKPAHYLIWFARDGSLEERCYWNIKEFSEQSQKHPLHIGEADAISRLENLLRDAVSLRMEADVPLGAFLSGGVDSSLVVSLMQAQSSSPIKTFSVGFDVKGFNEAHHAKEVAHYLGTQHKEQYLSSHEAAHIAFKLGQGNDEPFADSSQIATYFISQIAKQDVSVCLTGDGGDELFGGYGRYFHIPELWKVLAKIPGRNTVGYCFDKMPLPVLQVALLGINKLLNKKLTASKLKTWLALLKARSPYDLYQKHMMEPGIHYHLINNPSGQLSPTLFDFSEFEHAMMMHDTLNYMPGDILTKVDRATMAVSLEGRAPLLDHRIAEFAWQLPLEQKIRKGQGKWILKEVLYRHVPKKLIERPKMGFGVPLGEWLRYSLKDWGESLLCFERLKKQELLNAEVVRSWWDDHQKGKGDYSNHLWPVIMLQAWFAARGA